MIKLLGGKESKLLQCSGNCPKTSNDRGEQMSFCAIYLFQKALAMIEGLVHVCPLPSLLSLIFLMRVAGRRVNLMSDGKGKPTSK